MRYMSGRDHSIEFTICLVSKPLEHLDPISLSNSRTRKLTSQFSCWTEEGVGSASRTGPTVCIARSDAGPTQAPPQTLSCFNQTSGYPERPIETSKILTQPATVVFPNPAIEVSWLEEPDAVGRTHSVKWKTSARLSFWQTCRL